MYGNIEELELQPDQYNIVDGEDGQKYMQYVEHVIHKD